MQPGWLAMAAVLAPAPFPDNYLCLKIVEVIRDWIVWLQVEPCCGIYLQLKYAGLGYQVCLVSWFTFCGLQSLHFVVVFVVLSLVWQVWFIVLANIALAIVTHLASLQCLLDNFAQFMALKWGLKTLRMTVSVFLIAILLCLIQVVVDPPLWPNHLVDFG